MCPELLTCCPSQKSVNKRWLSELQPALATRQGRLARGSFTEGRRSSVACREKAHVAHSEEGVPEGEQAARFAAPSAKPVALSMEPPPGAARPAPPSQDGGGRAATRATGARERWLQSPGQEPPRALSSGWKSQQERPGAVPHLPKQPHCSTSIPEYFLTPPL